MKWKHLTNGIRSYFVNLENVVYMQEIKGGTRLVFGPRAQETSSFAILVEQTPHEILDEDVS